jgi:2-polyprenyl-3-methyl-5-hydroxy-6-metoxy-1,4-benzoquinol methylase
MDLSSNMVTIGMQRRVQEAAESSTTAGQLLLDNIAFEISDINKRDYQAAAFDCIHSRETLLHLRDKASLLKKFQVKIQFSKFSTLIR